MYLKIYYFIKKFFSKTFRFLTKSSYLIKNTLKIIVLLIFIFTFMKMKGWF